LNYVAVFILFESYYFVYFLDYEDMNRAELLQKITSLEQVRPSLTLKFMKVYSNFQKFLENKFFFESWKICL